MDDTDYWRERAVYAERQAERYRVALREIELHSNGHLGWGLDSDPYFQAIAKPGRIAREALADQPERTG